MAARILIVYESKNGQTHKISKYICDRMSQQGHTVEMMRVNQILPVALSNYDGVIVGAPIYMRSYPRLIRKWVAQHGQELNKKQSAFFSVCMQVLQKDEQSQRDLLMISETFFKKTAWYPKRRKVFAGAVVFSRYNVFVRYVMKSFSVRAGKPLDVHHDYEFTPWTEVARFSDDFISSLRLSEKSSPDGLVFSN